MHNSLGLAMRYQNKLCWDTAINGTVLVGLRMRYAQEVVRGPGVVRHESEITVYVVPVVHSAVL